MIIINYHDGHSPIAQEIIADDNNIEIYNYDIEIIDEDSNEFYLLDVDKSENYDNCITLYIAQ